MNLELFFEKNNLKEGQRIEFEYVNKKIIGNIIPSKEDLMLKLDSGYNAGFNINKIKNLKKISEEKKVSKGKQIIPQKNPALPTIAILHTGGTIASRVNYSTGGVYASFDVNDIITMFPELTKIANIESVFVSNMMSEDMGVEDYKKISNTVFEITKKNIKGIIIGHGTDTLGYSAAALSFELKNCPLPVIIVGSQRSSDRGSSDAGMNLICAAEFIAKTNFKGVAVCMHNSTNDDNCAILPSTKVRKMHTSRRDAFKPINDEPIALVNYKTKEIKWIKEKENYEKNSGKFELINNFEKKVGLVKMHPLITEKEIEFYKKEKYLGLIIEGTGLGHTPVRENDLFIKKIKELIENGCIVLMTSQCLNGRVHPNVYTNLRKLSSIGVIYCEDMLPETALIKLSWLLGNYPKNEVEKMIIQNISSEITTFSKTNVYENTFY